MSTKRTKPEAYRELYRVLADEIGSSAALILISETNPGTEVMVSLSNQFTQRTGVIHDLDPMKDER